MPNEALLEQSFFFTPQERDEIDHLDVRIDKSLLTRLLRPMWWYVSFLIPDTVAPNAIALLGVVFSMQALQVLRLYLAREPTLATGVACALLMASTWCSALDGVHAERCRSHSVIGKIFSEACDSVRQVFFALTLVDIGGVKDLQSQWYLVMSLQLLRLWHTFVKMSPLQHRVRSDKGRERVRTASYLLSSTEVSLLQVLFLLFRDRLPMTDVVAAATEYAPRIYWGMAGFTILSVVLLRGPAAPSLIPLVTCMFARVVPTFFVPLNDLSGVSILADAIFVAVLSFEVMLSTMARRSVHTAMTIIAVLGMLNSVLCLIACGLYVAGVIVDISMYTRIPVFVPVRNVYIDGVFDLCHVGHKRLMENALKHGNRLIVGVMSDEDCLGYKRPPIMNCEERCTEVRSCKFVSKVIPGAPCHGLTEQFLRAHNIHVVVHGEEYLPTPEKPDKYYDVPRRLGMTKVAPRTPGMSTSTIIARILASDRGALVAKDKLSGGSTVVEPGAVLPTSPTESSVTGKPGSPTYKRSGSGKGTPRRRTSSVARK